MKAIKSIIVGLVALATFTGTAGTALAIPVPAFTASTQTPRVGVPVTFDGSASTCSTLTCGYRWSWQFRTAGGQTLNGGQMGYGPVVTYTFDGFAASKPYVIVTLVVVESNSTHNSRGVSKTYVVSL